ncbi:MAG: hypothetical protein ACXAE3_04835 [Candidatus Kariarchaeaceae archaeon]|jgi:hypothetical protein
MSQDFKKQIESIVQTPSVAWFIYFAVILASGIVILRFAVDDGLVFGRSILFMVAWFFLIVSLQPPKGADFESDPFDNVGIVE